MTDYEKAIVNARPRMRLNKFPTYISSAYGSHGKRAMMHPMAYQRSRDSVALAASATAGPEQTPPFLTALLETILSTDQNARGANNMRVFVPSQAMSVASPAFQPPGGRR